MSPSTLIPQHEVAGKGCGYLSACGWKRDQWAWLRNSWSLVFLKDKSPEVLLLTVQSSQQKRLTQKKVYVLEILAPFSYSVNSWNNRLRSKNDFPVTLAPKANTDKESRRDVWLRLALLSSCLTLSMASTVLIRVLCMVAMRIKWSNIYKSLQGLTHGRYSINGNY